MNSFPKIFALGTKYVKEIFDEEVEITEKIDGSQFVFGKIEGELKMRSKSAKLFLEKHDKMFSEAVEYVSTLDLPEGMVFYCEYLKKPKHNSLAYDKIPKNHLCLFAACDEELNFASYEELEKLADLMKIDVVPCIFEGFTKATKIEALLDRDSYLGGQKIEGVVVKNRKSWLFGGVPMPIMSGKYVSEAFKEVHNKTWKTGKDKWEIFKESYQTEARWEKAVQHLKEKGELVDEPKDIGKLCKEVHDDIVEEEEEIIRDFLWNLRKGELLRRSVSGLPEWYKKKLLLKDENE